MFLRGTSDRFPSMILLLQRSDWKSAADSANFTDMIRRRCVSRSDDLTSFSAFSPCFVESGNLQEGRPISEAWQVLSCRISMARKSRISASFFPNTAVCRWYAMASPAFRARCAMALPALLNALALGGLDTAAILRHAELRSPRHQFLPT